MIKISSSTYTPTSGKAPFTYVWSSPNPCISFDEPTGTVQAGKSFTTTIYANDQTCFAYGIDKVELVITDANDCQSTHNFYPLNPCSTLLTSAIVPSVEYLTYSISVGGGHSPYNFEWSVYPNVFSKQVTATSNNSSKVHFTLNPGKSLPEYIKVTCDVQDGNNCITSVSQSFSTDIILLDNLIADTYCIFAGNSTPNGFSSINFNKFPKNLQQYALAKTKIPYTQISDCQPDWSTLSADLPDNNIQVQITNDGYISLYGIKSTLFSPNGLLTIPYYVYDCKGVRSKVANIILSKVSCNTSLFGPTTCPLIVKDLCITNCEEEFTINLEDLIPSPDCCSDNDVDWSTLDVLPGAPTPPATAEYNPSNHTITYTANGSTSISDLILWGVFDTKGNYSGTKKIQVARICPTAPSCTDDCYYVSTNAIDHPLHVLMNDLGPNLNPASLIISVPPTHGTAYVLDGDIYYTPFFDYEGDDTLKYKIANYDGLYCEATVTLHNANDGPAGTGNNIISCTTGLSIFNDIEINGVDNQGRFDFKFTAYKGMSIPLVNGDELDVQVIVNGSEIASATLIIGQNPKLVTGVKPGTDDNWLTGTNFSQYLSSAVLSASSLVTGQTYKFHKKDWAWATDNVNSYDDPYHPITPVQNAKDIVIRTKARSIPDSLESLFDTDIVKKVKVFMFEDTVHTTPPQANGAGVWEPGAGFAPGYRNVVPPPPYCVGNIPDPLAYFSAGDALQANDLTGNYDTAGAYNVCCPKTITEYKIVGSPVVTTSDNFTQTTELATVLNSYNAKWTGGSHLSWDNKVNKYNIYGHNATYYNSTYLLVTDPELEYFKFTYAGVDGFNVGVTNKCTPVSFILF